MQIAEPPTGEAHAEFEVSEPEEEPTDRQKTPRKLLLERVSWEVLGRWDPREINAEDLDAAILEHAKQAFVASGITKLHFIKSTDKDLASPRWMEEKRRLCHAQRCSMLPLYMCP